MSLEKLKKLKSVLEEQQREKAKVEGQLESAMDRLKELGYKKVAEAEAAIAEMDVELDELESEVTSITAELEEKYAYLLT